MIGRMSVTVNPGVHDRIGVKRVMAKVDRVSDFVTGDMELPKNKSKADPVSLP